MDKDRWIGQKLYDCWHCAIVISYILQLAVRVHSFQTVVPECEHHWYIEKQMSAK